MTEQGNRATPLNPEERARVYALQLWLGCTKQCPRCRLQRPMETFEDAARLYSTCETCRMGYWNRGGRGRPLVQFDSDTAMKNWFADLKSGAGASR